MSIETSETTLETLLRQVEDMESNLQSLRRTILDLLRTSAKEDSAPVTEKRSIVDVLADASGQRVLKTANEVDQYLAVERSSWDD